MLFSFVAYYVYFSLHFNFRRFSFSLVQIYGFSFSSFFFDPFSEILPSHRFCELHMNKCVCELRHCVIKILDSNYYSRVFFNALYFCVYATNNLRILTLLEMQCVGMAIKYFFNIAKSKIDCVTTANVILYFVWADASLCSVHMCDFDALQSEFSQNQSLLMMFFRRKTFRIEMDLLLLLSTLFCLHVVYVYDDCYSDAFSIYIVNIRL